MLSIQLIPLLTDNYAYLLRDEATKKTAVVDPSEAKPILELLKQKGLQLDYVLSTHHHWDHTGGNKALKQETGCQVVGYAGDAERIPGIDIQLEDNVTFSLGESMAKVLFIPGHTLGHIAYWFEADKAVFCGDTLFSLGCGRLFEGTPEQMHESLQRLAALPGDTQVYCGHEYTVDNAKFALTCEPENKALPERYAEASALREKRQPTIPSTIEMELAANPFLRVKNAGEFAKVRARKDNF